MAPQDNGWIRHAAVKVIVVEVVTLLALFVLQRTFTP